MPLINRDEAEVWLDIDTTGATISQPLAEVVEDFDRNTTFVTPAIAEKVKAGLLDSHHTFLDLLTDEGLLDCIEVFVQVVPRDGGGRAESFTITRADFAERDRSIAKSMNDHVAAGLPITAT